jgi:hypothetical protein
VRRRADVERDTEEAFDARRELTSLLVERIAISRNGEDHPKVDVTYRFGPPEGADGVQNSEKGAKTHGRDGSEGLLRGHSKMSSYEVAVEREPEAYGSD